MTLQERVEGLKRAQAQLLVGEFARLSGAILKLSGLDSDAEEEAKNS